MNEHILIWLVMISQFGLHYFPWKVLLRGRELPRLMAYTLGLLGIMVPYSVWLYLNGMGESIGVLWMVIGAAGVVVFACWGLDHYLDLIMRDIESNEVDEVRKGSRVKK